MTGGGGFLCSADITDAGMLGGAMAGVDAVFHIAGDYRVNIKESEHEAMFRANVDGAVTVLDAAVSASVGSFVCVSTVAVLGNTQATVVDET